MATPSYFVGIDGGGSTTRALITDSDSNPIGYGEAGPCNPNTVGCLESAKQIDQAFRAAVEDSKRDIVPTAVHAGIAGVGNQEVVAALKNELRKLPWFPESRSEITHDLVCALEGGLAGQPGIVLVAGTGSAAYGKNTMGETARASGRDLGEDDPGSGYAIGRALASLPLSEISSTLEHCIRKHKLQPDLRIDSEKVQNRPLIAALAPIAIEAAERGDSRCIEIVDRNAISAAQLIISIGNRLYSPGANTKFVLQGGLLNRNEYYRDLVVSQLIETTPSYQYNESESTPVFGAVKMAQAIQDQS